MRARNLTTGDVGQIFGVSIHKVIDAYDGGLIKGHRVPGSRIRRFALENIFNLVGENDQWIRGFLCFLERGYAEKNSIVPEDLRIDALIGGQDVRFHTDPIYFTTGKVASFWDVSQQSVIRRVDKDLVPAVKAIDSKFRRIEANDVALFAIRNNIPSSKLETVAPVFIDYPYGDGGWERVLGGDGIEIYKFGAGNLSVRQNSEDCGLYIRQSDMGYECILVGRTPYENGILSRKDHGEMVKTLLDRATTMEFLSSMPREVRTVVLGAKKRSSKYIKP